MKDIEPDEKYAVSFASGAFKVRKDPDISLWCISNDCQSCSVVIPQLAYEQIDAIVTQYAEKQKIVATCGCKRLHTDTPILVPAVMSVATYETYYVPLSKYMANKLPPPKSLAQIFLQNVEFLDHDENLSIPLKRQAKNLINSDYFTRDREGNKVEIYVLYFAGMGKPYSIKEIYKLKLKYLFG
jgi:hypothetical protein